ncbi:tudor domain-containing protein 7A [Oryzias melastigma]|uniref:tudor domain-containing protein 7A n=1 Tax=Oryzias melastigma TaxID=30732 RepID=UPI000CF7E6CB|nr:tudor domain-containing protein 7A [Oryzias melastigma]
MDKESIEKVLRAVLQSCKSGISIRSLQSEFHSLCGENIPLRRLGFQTLEDYLKSIPSVVKLEYRMGEMMCFACVCEATAHIAELVARQKSPKKPARFKNVRYGLKGKPPDPYLPNAIPRFSLKQPSYHPSAGRPGTFTKPTGPHDGSRNYSNSGFYKPMKQETRPFAELQHRRAAAPPAGMQQATPPAGMQQAALIRKEPGMEKKRDIECKSDSRQTECQSSPYVEAEVQNKIKQLLKKYCCGLWMSKLSGVYKEMFQQELHPQVLTDLQKWTDVCIVERATFKNPPDFLIYPLLVSQLKTMNNPLFVNVLYQDVCVSNVCPDGTLYCQLPSPDSLRLAKILEEINASVVSQMTTASLVSKPFIGKFCLARFKEKWARAEISRMFGERVMEVLFIDFAVPATVKLTDLREVPPQSLKECAFIPPQAVKCRLADVEAPGGDWSPEAIVWLKEKVLEAECCKVKILKLDESKGDRVAHIHLFVGGDGPQNSINLQLVQSKLLQRAPSSRGSLIDAALDVSWTLPVLKRTFSDPTLNCSVDPSLQSSHKYALTIMTPKPLALPAPLELPEPGQNMDVFVVVACHPGYFVMQPWRDMDKLESLMWRMFIYYSQKEESSTLMNVQKGDVCAAKINQQWHRVQVKRVLANGFVSVYELDYGQQELVPKSLIQPLVEPFRQLSFQAVPAQLAGVTQCQWSPAACMLFRNRVEQRALVAQVESFQDVAEEVKDDLWRRKLTVYLVDTTLEDEDLWIHCIMAEME